MIDNYITKNITAPTGVKTSVGKAVNQMLIGVLSEQESELTVFEFETDDYNHLQINDWTCMCQDRVCFPVANSVSGQTMDVTDDMKVYGGYIISKYDTTIPVYADTVRVNMLSDLFISLILSVLNSDYQYSNLLLQTAKQFIKYFSMEEKIEEVNNAILDELDNYIL
jgi:hypothetical protein